MSNLPEEVKAENLAHNPWDKFRSEIQGQAVREIGEARVVDTGSVFFVDKKPRFLFRGALGADEYSNQLKLLIADGTKTGYAIRLFSDKLPAPGRVEISIDTMQRKGELGEDHKKPKVGDKVILTAWQSEAGSVLYGFRTPKSH